MSCQFIFLNPCHGWVVVLSKRGNERIAFLKTKIKLLLENLCSFCSISLSVNNEKYIQY